MAVENRYQIDVNMKSRMFREIPEVVANDKVIFEIKVYDGSVIFPLLGTYTYHLTSLKPGGQSIIREGSLSGDVIVFELGTSEMTVPGKVEGTVQIFDENNDRISSSKFDYVVKRDPSLQGSLPADNTTLVIANESLLTEAITKADNADNRINNIVAQAGTDNTEIVDMRLRNDGTVAPTAGGHLRELSDQLADIAINPKKYGFKGDGAADDSVALASMFSSISSGAVIKFPKNSIIRLNSDVITDKSCEIDFQNSTIESYSENGLKFVGILKGTFTVTADYVETSSKNSLALNSVAGIEVGDLINVKSTELFDTSRAYYYKGGNAIVTKISGNTVYFNLVFPFDMAAASITVSIYKPVTVNIKNIRKMDGKQDLSLSKNGITIEYGKDCSIEKVKTNKFQSNITLKRCVNSKLDLISTGNAKNSTADSWDGYGIQLYSCTIVKGTHLMTNSGQHGLTWGGQEVNFGLHFEDSVFKAEVWNMGIGAHENVHDVLFENVKSFGFTLAGNVVCVDCDFMPSEVNTNTDLLLSCAETTRRANYKFLNSRFNGLAVVINDYYQVDSPTRKYIGDIVFEDCRNFALNPNVNRQSNGAKIAEIDNIILNRVKEYNIASYDIINNMEIRNAHSTRNTNIIIQGAVGGVFQKIKRLYLHNVTVPRRYDVITLSNVDDLTVEKLAYNLTDYGNERITLQGIVNANFKQFDLSLSNVYGLNSASKFTNLYMEDSKLRSSATGLNTIFLAATRLNGKEVTNLRTNEVRDYQTSPNGNKYSVYVGDTGAFVITQLA